MERVFRTLRGAQGRPRARRLRGPARAGDPHVRRGRRRAGRLPRALPRVHRGRVPGRQPAPADAARALARRPRRPLRRRRRLPVDLLLHRARRPSTCSGCRRGSRARSSCGWRRTTARRPRSSPWRTGSCRSWAAPRRCCARCSPAARSRWRWCSPTGWRRPRSWSARCAASPARACPYEEMAVLYRLNARSEDYEEAFALAGIPFQVRGAAFIRRPGGAADAAAPARPRDASAVGAVAEVVRQPGLDRQPARPASARRS